METMETAVVGTDDLHIFETLGAETEAMGYEAVWTSNGVELIEEIGRQCPAVVFIDASIPVIGAYGCCSELRRDRTLPQNLPIFLLTDDEINPFILLRFGFSGTFPKRHGFYDLREFLAHNVWK
jgi:DNA-binding response OmpR family regulator